jgi:aspartyl-tRNA(Asn)/glutamyl-tRNA(Gln) amidotransferase subunit C
MTDRIDPQIIRHIASLSRIHVDAEKIPELAAQFGKIIAYFDKLNELDTADVEPMTGAVEQSNVLRKDRHEPSLSRERGLMNAPEQEAGFFKVPKVLGDS